MDTTSVTRTLSRIPNIFLDAARSTTDCNAREHQQVFEDPSSHDQETDPTVETPRLPEDHPVYLLEEARTFYQGQEPTFALRRHRENVPTVILAATSSTPCKRAKLVAKLWDAKTMFWTLDLNNVRYIVKCFRGLVEPTAVTFCRLSLYLFSTSVFHLPSIALEFSCILIGMR